MNQGLFITFEGVEGSGKTTQIEKCAAYLKKKDLDICATKEPGGTESGIILRDLILNPETKLSSPYSEALLFVTDRLEHCEQIIRPALEKNKIVLCDRYTDSTIAYQIGGRELPSEQIHRLNDFTELIPDLTILLDLDPEEGLKRATKRAELDRFEQFDIAFHQRVRNAYLNLCESFPNRINKVDISTKTPDEVFDNIRPLIDKLLESRVK